VFFSPFPGTGGRKYILHFGKVATSLDWPKDNWTFLLQSVLVGKAQDTSLDQSSDYETVKSAVLNAYALVPEAYRQKFRESRKSSN